MSASNNPQPSRAWVPIVGAVAAMFALAVSVMLLVTGFIGVGIWKGGMEVRVSAIETASKEQVTALKESTDKQISAVVASGKEMVTALQENTNKRLDAIERDRSEKLQDASHFRSETTGILVELKTISAQQQKQIDLLLDDSPARRSKR